MELAVLETGTSPAPGGRLTDSVAHRLAGVVVPPIIATPDGTSSHNMITFLIDIVSVNTVTASAINCALACASFYLFFYVHPTQNLPSWN